jgi:hypothetical protein
MTIGVVTLGSIRTELRQRIDRVNSQFFTDAELNGYISNSYKELYDILVQKFGDDYYVATPYQFTTDGTNDTYALPADFYKLLGCDAQYNGAGSTNGWITLRQFMMAERNSYTLPNYQAFYGITNLRYRLRDDNIWFIPVPAAGQVCRIFYIPRPAALTADADTVDGVSGWEEYILLDAAIKCMVKEESDPSAFAAQKMAVLQRIESAAENRNAGAPQTVSDIHQSFWPYGGWGPGSNY